MPLCLPSLPLSLPPSLPPCSGWVQGAPASCRAPHTEGSQLIAVMFASWRRHRKWRWQFVLQSPSHAWVGSEMGSGLIGWGVRTAGTLGACEGPLETALQLVDGGRDRGSGRSREKERDRRGELEEQIYYSYREETFLFAQISLT